MADFDVPFHFYIVSFVTHTLAAVLCVCLNAAVELNPLPKVL